MQFSPLYKTTEQINSVAQNFLNSYWSSHVIPIPIEEIIDLQLGIDIIPIPGLKDAFEKVGLDIDAFISSDFTNISVDKYIQEKRSNRYRFTLAHEIGHMLLHRYLYSQFKFDTIAEWLKAIELMPMVGRLMVEWQANEFAGLILVPRMSLKIGFQKALKETEKIINVSYKDRPDFLIDLTIISLASKFEVSEEAMRIRIERDGLK